MLTTCECEHCSSRIEFDAATLEKSGETSYRVLGQSIDCPNCGKSTVLYIPRHSISSKKLDAPEPANRFAMYYNIAAIFLCGLGFIADSADWLGVDENDLKYLVFGFLSLPLYFVPTVVGWPKKNRQAIFILNFCLGWTFIGWVAALVWASTKD